MSGISGDPLSTDDDNISLNSLQSDNGGQSDFYEDQLLADDMDGNESETIKGTEGSKRNREEEDSHCPSAKVQKIDSIVPVDSTSAKDTGATDKPSLRGYQKEVSTNVLKTHNDIIILPTGTGKTAVAANLVLHHLQTRRYQGRSDKVKVLFLVPRVVLADQQLKAIKDYLGDKWRDKCRSLTGGDLDSMETLKNLILESEYSVIVATPQTILNYFYAYRCSTMRDFSLIILDECHNARGEDPFNKLLTQYMKERMENPKESALLPQLVGMTATVGIGGARTRGEAKDYIMSVCAKFGLNSLPAVVQKCKEELKAVVDQPMTVNEKVEAVRKDPFSGMLREIMEAIIKQVKEKLKSVPGCRAAIAKFKPNKDLMNLSLVQTVKETIMELTAVAAESENAVIEDCKKSLEHLKVYRQALVWANLATLQSSLDYIQERMEPDELRKCDCYRQYAEEWLAKLEELASKEDSDYPNKKLMALRKELDKVLKAERIEDDYTPRVMVFVEHRRLASMISDWLNSLGKEYKSERFVSSQTSTAEFGMTSADAKFVVEQFRSGELNILVATSVLSEGVDIPECNCVIRYMYIKDVIAEVQVPGRVRSKNGTTVAVFDEKLKKQYEDNKMSEKRMEQALKDIREMAGEQFADRMESLRKSQHREILKKEAKEKASLETGQSVADVQIVCRNCRGVAGQLADVYRYMTSHYIVLGPSITDKVILMTEDEGERIDAMAESGSLLCKGCSSELGKMYTMKIGSRVRRRIAKWSVKKVSLLVPGKDEPRNFGKWPDVKAEFAIPDIMQEDLLDKADNGELLD